MQHELREDDLLDRLGVGAAGATEAVERCVHCGFCLATCPTYAELADEADSPRGRIVLMKEVLEGTLELEDAQPHIDACLGCLACVSSCPSGVQYDALLEPFREMAEVERVPDRGRDAFRRRLLWTMESPSRFLWASRAAWLARPLVSVLPERLLPERWRGAMDLLGDDWPRRAALPESIPARGERRARVALLPGCVQQVVEADVHAATLEVLAHNGVEVVIPRDAVCCGALAAHVGEMERARELARRNLDALSIDVDAVVTNVAGCGSGLREMPRWLAGTADEAGARELAGRCRDVAVFLDELGARRPAELGAPLVAAVQDACHLRHAQGVVDAPRRLLRSIPGLELVEPAEPEMCCGSAGLYSLEHPDMARRLGQRKARKLRTTGAHLVVSGNVGCMVQLQRHLAMLWGGEGAVEGASAFERIDTFHGDDGPRTTRRASGPPRVLHLMQVMRAAYEGTLESAAMGE